MAYPSYYSGYRDLVSDPSGFRRSIRNKREFKIAVHQAVRHALVELGAALHPLPGLERMLFASILMRAIAQLESLDEWRYMEAFDQREDTDEGVSFDDPLFLPEDAIPNLVGRERLRLPLAWTHGVADGVINLPDVPIADICLARMMSVRFALITKLAGNRLFVTRTKLAYVVLSALVDAFAPNQNLMVRVFAMGHGNLDEAFSHFDHRVAARAIDGVAAETPRSQR